jgi:hypothetical protein
MTCGRSTSVEVPIRGAQRLSVDADGVERGIEGAGIPDLRVGRGVGHW